MKKVAGLMASMLVLTQALPVAASPCGGEISCGAERFAEQLKSIQAMAGDKTGNADGQVISLSRDEAMLLAGTYQFDSSRSLDEQDISSKTRRFLGVELALEWDEGAACIVLPLWQIKALLDTAVRPGPEYLRVESGLIHDALEPGQGVEQGRKSVQVCFFEDGIAVYAREDEAQYVLFFRRATA